MTNISLRFCFQLTNSLLTPACIYEEALAINWSVKKDFDWFVALFTFFVIG